MHHLCHEAFLKFVSALQQGQVLKINSEAANHMHKGLVLMWWYQFDILKSLQCALNIQIILPLWNVCFVKELWCSKFKWTKYSYGWFLAYMLLLTAYQLHVSTIVVQTSSGKKRTNYIKFDNSVGRNNQISSLAKSCLYKSTLNKLSPCVPNIHILSNVTIWEKQWIFIITSASHRGICKSHQSSGKNN